MRASCLALCAPATGQTILRMIRHPSITHLPGFFRLHGRSQGSVCPHVIKTQPSGASSGMKGFIGLLMDGKSTLGPDRSVHQWVTHPGLSLLPSAEPQTQNA